MRRLKLIFVWVGPSALVLACGDDPMATAPDAASDSAPDSAVAPDASPDASAPVYDDGVRLADMREDGVALDLCLAAGADPFGAPSLAASLPGGAKPQHVSAYVALAPGSWRARVIAAGADCASPIATDLSLTVDDGAYQTLLAVSAKDGGAAEVTAFDDERQATAQIHFRLLNASADDDAPSVKLGASALYASAPFGALPIAAPDAGVDPRGWADSPPMPVMNGPDGLPFWLHATTWSSPLQVRVMPLVAGDVVSLFVFGPPTGLGSLAATQTIIACKDLVASNGETSCLPYEN